MCLMLWILVWEVLQTHGTISHDHAWQVMPDLYFYRGPEEIVKEEQAAPEKAVSLALKATAPQAEATAWSEGVLVPSVPIQ